MTADIQLTEQNRQLVLEGYRLLAAGDLDAASALLREDFVEHNPHNPSGRDAFIEFMKNSPLADARVEIKRVIAEDDHVVVHCLMFAPGDHRGTVITDIWRIEYGLVAEHWDVHEPVPEEFREDIPMA